MSYTGAWDSWRAKQVNQIALNQGTQVIRIAIDGGEFNLGKMVFTLAEPNSGTNNAPIVSMSSPNSGSVVLLGSTQTLSASASDNGGSISLVEFFDGAVKIGEDSTPPYQINWQPSLIKTYSIKAIATDNENNKSTSSSISIIVNDENTCTVTSVEAEQGTFSEGYSVSFETIENDVIVTFELLDSDKDGVVSYLWKEFPFSEAPMNRVYGTKFSATLSNQTPGSTLSFACKFAYAGGMAVTKYFTYEVGTEFCETPCDNEVNLPNSQALTLPSGWSIFSTYITSSDSDITTVLEPLILNNQIIIVKDNTGMAYFPELDFNAIGDLIPGQGYQIKTTEACYILIPGQYEDPQNMPIALNVGWNTIGHLSTESIDADVVLQNLITENNLIIAKDFKGNILHPSTNFNSIGDMKPGEGYQLKVKDASSITYEYKDPCNNVD